MDNLIIAMVVSLVVLVLVLVVMGRFIIMERSPTVHQLMITYLPLRWQNYGIIWSNELITLTHRIISDETLSHYGFGSYEIVDKREDEKEEIIITCHLTKKKLISKLAPRHRDYQFYDLNGKTYHHTHYPGTTVVFRRGPATIKKRKVVEKTNPKNLTDGTINDQDIGKVEKEVRAGPRRRGRRQIIFEDLGIKKNWNY